MAEDTPPPGGTRPRPAPPARQGSGSDTGYAVVGTMLSGMAVWGGAGWLLDRWLDTKVFFPVGILLGMGVAIYLVVVKYGAVEPPPARRPSRTRAPVRGSRPPTEKGRR